MKAGLNKLILLEQSVESTSKITLPDHLKEKFYKIVSVGNTRTNFDHVPPFAEGDTVHITPSTGFKVKVDSTEYVVCTFDDVLLVR